MTHQFGGYKSVFVQTEPGDQSQDELNLALKHFPNAKFILALGVAYANNPEKAKYGDVLVSKFIDGVGNIKNTKGGVKIFRACSSRFTEVLPGLRNVFAMQGRANMGCTHQMGVVLVGRGFVAVGSRQILYGVLQLEA